MRVALCGASVEAHCCGRPLAGVCLNNCSYPNGECDNGVCVCAVMPNPYNRSREYVAYKGDDCSFGTSAFAAHVVTLAHIVICGISHAICSGDVNIVVNRTAGVHCCRGCGTRLPARAIRR